ncbi:hypothetical protein HCH43_02515 [Klebsiella pneumoniae]|uniref:hypothetical protein n=1 Tax=Klebsiella pneumoniae TaxID=573 RepID=UPI001B8BEA33|nr:hypothetical protein [Klebsiella pneumoniae]EKU0735396.1 hypothetical protein [Klebsiella pneumoniae]MBR7371583.1 hypothetical protein [Klebsiella pneumoniae]MBX8862051.1 hypothetical protein [Klebsiella pneumoniae]HBY7571328.1 hypothetical protein [Klebsiella pneumoniae]
MKERGMIFNGEMVRAILDDRKMQTRRPVKFPVHDKNLGCELAGNELAGELSAGNYLNSAFGKPGDRIWVRETWATLGNEDGCCVDWEGNLCKGDERPAARIYRASCEQRPGDYGLWSIPDDAYWKPHTKEHKFEGAWRPSIHMPRWASRILLEITDVRVERLNSISQEDAQAEGLELTGWRPTYSDPDSGGEVMTPYDNFAELWSSIYGEESWKANPWVWVIEFKRVEGGAA